MRQIVSYLRVSTKEQGLGIDAQRAVVRAYCKAQSARIVSEYEEKESGKRDDRPALGKAIADARKWKAVLVVAKLDRLSRDTHFITGLLKSDVEFHFCDLPQANKMLLHIMASVAEGEREMISARTKAALAQAKARGVKLGGANPACRDNLKPAAQAIGRAKAAKAISAKARAADALIVNDMQTLKTEGHSLKEIAEALNARGLTGQRGNPWNAMQVSRTLKRAKNT
jgi:DNA invertase Pin-like site-specific DNA recombinase